MLLWVYIHTGQAWKICLATVGFEPTTFGILAQCSANWATLRVTSHKHLIHLSTLHQHSKFQVIHMFEFLCFMLIISYVKFLFVFVNKYMK